MAASAIALYVGITVLFTKGSAAFLNACSLAESSEPLSGSSLSEHDENPQTTAIASSTDDAFLKILFIFVLFILDNSIYIIQFELFDLHYSF
jgi:hypothetical protein